MKTIETNQGRRSQLRRQFREARNALSHNEQDEASAALVAQVAHLFDANQTFALYLANDAEISPALLIAELESRGKDIALPVMHGFRKGYLNFQRYHIESAMHQNGFGILEPKPSALDTFALSQIDVLCMPLVAFDAKGNRLGMGGGFYDRTLNRLHTLSHPPKLIGLAHDCQQCEQLPIEGWDIPLDCILTPTQKIFIKDIDI